MVASSHTRAIPGECRPPPVLGWTHGVTPGTHTCAEHQEFSSRQEKTPRPQPRWDGSWGKQVQKSRWFAHQCWLEVTIGSAPITGQHSDP